MKSIPRAALLLLISLGLPAAEVERRAFFDPQDRAAKFQVAGRIFPAVKVRAADTAWPLDTSPRAASFAPRYAFEGATYDIEQFNERTKSNALLILKDGKIVYETYRNGSSPSTKFISFSMGKSFTSTMVGMALEDGLIGSIDEPLTKYLPALTASAYDGVTIRDALQMVSGVEWDESAYDWTDNSKPLVRLWNEAYVEQRYRFVEGANTLARAYPPGEVFNYNTLESSLLGWLVEHVAKTRFATYFEERLWQAAGMEFDAAWLLDGPPDIGREMTGGGLTAALRDFGRFGLMMANGGQANGRQLLSAEWVRAASTAEREAVRYGRLYDGYPLGYGYQWWLFDNGRFEAQGVYGQLIYIAPRESVVIVKLSYWPEAWVEDMEFESYAFFAAVIDALK